MIRALRSAPPPVLWLGLGGLLPFLGLGAWLSLDDAPPAAALDWLIAYAALIAAFVGALQWGLAMRQEVLPGPEAWWLYGWGVMPSLLAWVALALPSGPALWSLAALFPLAWLMDLRAVRRLGAPAWYLPLRTVLSTLVTLTLVLTAAGLPAPA